MAYLTYEMIINKSTLPACFGKRMTVKFAVSEHLECFEKRMTLNFNGSDRLECLENRMTANFAVSAHLEDRSVLKSE